MYKISIELLHPESTPSSVVELAMMQPVVQSHSLEASICGLHTNYGAHNSAVLLYQQLCCSHSLGCFRVCLFIISGSTSNYIAILAIDSRGLTFQYIFNEAVLARHLEELNTCIQLYAF